VKVKLADLDRSTLLGLIKDLYTASKDNQHFLHTRFGVGEDVLAPYKATIERWLWPDVYKNQDYSVSKAKKAITDYKKAAGQPAGVAELSVFYCEQAIGFCNAVGLDDADFYYALVGMAERALGIVMSLPEMQREPFLDRLEDVQESCRGIGWGLEDAFNDLFRRAGLELDG
jgi:hypothetical protein